MKRKYEVIFNPENHTYTVNGQEAVSVTTILQEVGIAESFEGMPQIVLDKVKAAAERGNYYDELAEDAILHPFELNEWQERFLEVLKEHNITPTKVQQRIGTIEPFPIAGSPDVIGIDANGNDVIIDVKATYRIYTQSVTWQTNMYSWLEFENHEKARKFVLHYDEESDTFTMVELKNILSDTILRMLETYQLGEQFVEMELILGKKFDIVGFSQAFDNIQLYKELLKEEEAKVKAFEEEMIKQMSENSIKTLELENFRITHTPETTRNTISWKNIVEETNEVIDILLKEIDNEELTEQTNLRKQILLEKHTKTSNIKARLTITQKK